LGRPASGKDSALCGVRRVSAVQANC
jgi:hypothetical protein